MTPESSRAGSFHPNARSDTLTRAIHRTATLSALADGIEDKAVAASRLLGLVESREARGENADREVQALLFRAGELSAYVEMSTTEAAGLSRDVRVLAGLETEPELWCPSEDSSSAP
ncbi:MAG: hypothetical protein H6741_27805 [Alphaproteobacteria bacterium]|nr:hypothetical protein [Alphaproteobacteria bacterium]